MNCFGKNKNSINCSSVLIAILFFVGANILVAADNIELNIRDLKPPTPKSKESLSSKLEKIEPPPKITPKNIEIEIIQPDTNTSKKIDTSATDIIEKPKIQPHLGEITDIPFFLDTNIIMKYEPRADANGKQISSDEYSKYFAYITELFLKKFFEHTVNEINELLKYRLFDGERMKLNFIKTAALLEDKKLELANQTLNLIKNADVNSIYRPYYLFYLARYYELNNNPDNAINEYLKIYKLNPENQIADDALYGLAVLLANKKNYKESVNYLDIIIEYYPQSDFADDALFLKAKLYDTITEIKDYGKAEFHYRNLYKVYPKSKFANDALKRGDEIRRNFL